MSLKYEPLKQGDALPALGLSKARDRLRGPRTPHPDAATVFKPQRMILKLNFQYRTVKFGTEKS